MPRTIREEKKMTAQPSTNGLQNAEDQIKHVPVTDIFADTEWNARSAANTTSEVDELAQDKTERFAGLKASIFNSGQDEPIVLRRVTQGKTMAGHKTDKPYELVAGFRRFAAVSDLNTNPVHQPERDGAKEQKRNIVPNTPDGTIRAVVRDLNPAESRSVNLRENTARNNLDTPDLVFGARELALVHKWPEVQVRNQLNISQSYCNQIIRLARVDRKILEHWRNGGEFEGIQSKSRVPVSAMFELAKLDPDQWTREYKRLLAGKKEADESGDKQWIDAGKKRAEQYGRLIAGLQDAGFLKLTGKVNWIDVIDPPEGKPVMLISSKQTGKTGVKRPILRKWADAAEKAFQKFFEESEEEEEEEDAE